MIVVDNKLHEAIKISIEFTGDIGNEDGFKITNLKKTYYNIFTLLKRTISRNENFYRKTPCSEEEK